MGRGSNNFLYSQSKDTSYQPKTDPRIYSKSEQRFQPEMIAVESSNIAAIGYDETRRELHVSFKPSKNSTPDKTQGYYINVPKQIFEEMLASESKGKYMRQILGPSIQYEWKYFDLTEKESISF